MKKYRDKIDLIDDKMLDLFIERMNTVKKIKEYKKLHNLEILDKKREDELKKDKLSKIKNKNTDYYDYYKQFIETILKVSKDFQAK